MANAYIFNVFSLIDHAELVKKTPSLNGEHQHEVIQAINYDNSEHESGQVKH
jgi:hypothetical protein